MTTLLREALEFLDQQSRAAADVQVVRLPGEDRKALVFDATGFQKEFAIPPAARRHEVLSLPAFLTACERWGGDEDAGDQSIWHDESRCVLVIDDDDRRDVVTLKLTPSEQFRKLETLGKTSLEQREVIRLLRHDLAGCVPENLTSLFRKLDFARNTNGTADIKHNQETLGRSVAAEIIGAEDLPETIKASVPVYVTPGLTARVPVVLGVEIDLRGETFKIEPLPDELTKAVQLMQAELHEQLVQFGETRVLYGDPKLGLER